MDYTSPQRSVPLPGRAHVRIGESVFEIPDVAWEEWVRGGRVPPDALVFSHRWSRGVWRRADALETYHLFLPTRAGYHQPGIGPDPSSGIPSPDAGRSQFLPLDRIRPALPRAIWGRGVSIMHALCFVNLGISATLAWFWGAEYTDRLWALSASLRDNLLSGWIPVLLAPLFLHASTQHLMGNLLALVAGGAAVEEFYGRRRTLCLYLASGLCGAAFSLLREKPVLTVGASGAIMGMYGVMLLFLIRFRDRFSTRQKYKTARIYFPLVALAVLPSIFQADLLSHVGGFLGGAIMGLLVSPRPDLVPWAGKQAAGTQEIA